MPPLPVGEGFPFPPVGDGGLAGGGVPLQTVSQQEGEGGLGDVPQALFVENAVSALTPELTRVNVASCSSRRAGAGAGP